MEHMPFDPLTVKIQLVFVMFKCRWISNSRTYISSGDYPHDEITLMQTTPGLQIVELMKPLTYST